MSVCFSSIETAQLRVERFYNLTPLTLVAEHAVPSRVADALHAAVTVAVGAARKANALLAELASPERGETRLHLNLIKESSPNGKTQYG